MILTIYPHSEIGDRKRSTIVAASKVTIKRRIEKRALRATVNITLKGQVVFRLLIFTVVWFAPNGTSYTLSSILDNVFRYATPLSRSMCASHSLILYRLRLPISAERISPITNLYYILPVQYSYITYNQ